MGKGNKQVYTVQWLRVSHTPGLLSDQGIQDPVYDCINVCQQTWLELKPELKRWGHHDLLYLVQCWPSEPVKATWAHRLAPTAAGLITWLKSSMRIGEYHAPCLKPSQGCTRVQKPRAQFTSGSWPSQSDTDWKGRLVGLAGGAMHASSDHVQRGVGR